MTRETDMNYRKARIGTKVKFTKNTDMAAKGDVGIINELRGYNFDGGKKIGRFVMVWVTRNLPAIGKVPARTTESNCAATTEVIEIIN